MARYYVDIGQELLGEKYGPVYWPAGFRLIKPVHEDFARDIVRYLVEDDSAGREYEGCLIDPVFKQHFIVTNKGQLNEYREPGPLHVQKRYLVTDYRMDLHPLVS